MDKAILPILSKKKPLSSAPELFIYLISVLRSTQTYFTDMKAVSIMSRACFSQNCRNGLWGMLWWDEVQVYYKQNRHFRSLKCSCGLERNIKLIQHFRIHKFIRTYSYRHIFTRAADNTFVDRPGCARFLVLYLLAVTIKTHQLATLCVECKSHPLTCVHICMISPESKAGRTFASGAKILRRFLEWKL